MEDCAPNDHGSSCAPIKLLSMKKALLQDTLLTIAAGCPCMCCVLFRVMRACLSRFGCWSRPISFRHYVHMLATMKWRPYSLHSILTIGRPSKLTSSCSRNKTRLSVYYMELLSPQSSIATCQILSLPMCGVTSWRNLGDSTRWMDLKVAAGNIHISS